MFETPLRLAAVLCSLLVLTGWGLFATDELRSASDASAAEIAGLTASSKADPTPTQERAREQAHSGPREAIDDANDVLLAPFAGITDSAGSQWTRRTVPAALAFLIYGLGLGYLARYARGRA